MNRAQIALGLTLKAADISISVDSFHERLSVQKAVYLLEQSGLDLGYTFGWYIRGPYSRGLAHDLYTVVDSGPEEINKHRLTDASREKIKKVSNLWVDKAAKAYPPKWLELLASVVFLIRTRQAGADDAVFLSEILKKNQKDFSPEEVRAAVHELRETAGFAF
jgi:hypothetical protein